MEEVLIIQFREIIDPRIDRANVVALCMKLRLN